MEQNTSARAGAVWDVARSVAKDESLDWEALDGSRILVTGATGLIGSTLTRSLLERSELAAGRIDLVLAVRNVDKARRMFGEGEGLSYVAWELGADLDAGAAGAADYVVHTACNTSSRDFLNRPTMVIDQVIDGTEAFLRYARQARCKAAVFLSTMEVYGELDGRAFEDRSGSMDTMNPRNSYPEAKRLAECLCASYASEHGVPVAVVRLAQTFGAGVRRGDGRVFEDFASHVVAGEDIVMYSEGLKRNPYLSTGDAVRAILTVLAKGEPGLAYNAANEATYCSVREMADLVARELGDGRQGVVLRLDAQRQKAARKSSNLDMDTSRLRALGWEPKDGLEDMYAQMVASWD